MKNQSNVSKVILSANNILILPHIMADGDTLGSSVALYLALKKLGKNPCILLDEDIPNNLKFFIPEDSIAQTFDESSLIDLVISIDCSDLERLGTRKKYILNTQNTLNIDHHKTNTQFAKVNIIDSKAAATGEIIYEVIKTLQASISKEIATALYVAISTDTGSFKYDNTSPKTHLISAELLEYGINLNQVSVELYQNKPVYKMKLMIEALKTLEFYCDGKVGLISITNEMMDKVGANSTDSDGLIELARDLEGVEVGILLKEIKKEEIKIGLRSKYNIDVSKIAMMFDGGGHSKAAGCTMFENIENAKKKIVAEIKNILR